MALLPATLASDHSDDVEYLKLARAVLRCVAAGALPVGERMPSIREMSTSTRLSPGTVSASYDWLAQRGYIVAMTTKGYVVRMRPQLEDIVLDEVREFRGRLISKGYDRSAVRGAFARCLEDA